LIGGSAWTSITIDVEAPSLTLDVLDAGTNAACWAKSARNYKASPCGVFQPAAP
jgi:hypothetical protein